MAREIIEEEYPTILDEDTKVICCTNDENLKYYDWI